MAAYSLRKSRPLAADNLFGAVIERMSTWMKLAEERRALSQMDDRQLEDIGLTRADVEREAKRPFWDLPIGR